MNINDNNLFKSNHKTVAEVAIAGGLFVAQVRVTLSGNGGSADIGVVVPPKLNIILGAFEISATSGDFSLEIFEGADITGGTAISFFNPNRTAAVMVSSSTTLNPTVNDEGNLIALLETLGDNAAKAVGGLNNEVPTTLAEDTSYIYRITHNDANNRDFIIYFTGYAKVN